MAEFLLSNQIYCYHCKKYYPAPHPITSYEANHGSVWWNCPTCGAELYDLVEDVKQMPEYEQFYCDPLRHNGAVPSLSVWYKYHQKHARHPKLWTVRTHLLFLVLLAAVIPLIFVSCIYGFGIIVLICGLAFTILCGLWPLLFL